MLVNESSSLKNSIEWKAKIGDQPPRNYTFSRRCATNYMNTGLPDNGTIARQTYCRRDGSWNEIMKLTTDKSNPLKY